MAALVAYFAGRRHRGNYNKPKITNIADSAVSPNHGNEAMCPYCSHQLDRMPKSKRKCPQCGETIRVAKAGDSTKLLTEEGYQEYREQRKRDSFRRKWLRELEYYGISESDFSSARKTFFQKNRFEANDRDILWGLFNKAISQQSDLHDLKMLYLSMARFLYEEGRDHLQIHQQAMRMALKKYQQDGCTKVEIMDCGDSCGTCRQQNGKVLTIKDALREMPLPCQDCSFEPSSSTRGWCRCDYCSVID